MKGLVTTYLNERLAAPDLNAENPVYYEPGDVVEIVDIVNGEAYEGIDVWYELDNGAYIWSGGVQGNRELELRMPRRVDTNSDDYSFHRYLDESLANGQLKRQIDYREHLQISQELKVLGGKGVVVGVLDHPIRKDHMGFRESIRTFGGRSQLKPAIDHGTLMAGLIAGDSPIQGIARDAILLELPFYDGLGYEEWEWMKEILDYIKGLNSPLILNVSYHFDPIRLAPDIFLSLQDVAQKKNVLMVASAGTDQELQAPEIQFPASMIDVLAVGSASSAFLDQRDSWNINSRVDLIVPDFNYLSYGASTSKEIVGVSKDSAATAIVSGVAALYLSANPALGGDKTGLIRELTFNAEQVGASKKHLKLLNPHK